MDTKFASAERSREEDIKRQKKIITDNHLFIEILKAFPEIVLIINKNRQVVYCDEKLLTLLDVDLNEVLGKRPGEVFNCIHSHEEEGGCGTSSFCVECGAVNSILKAQKGEPNYSECRMTILKDEKNQSMDLRVWSVPISILDQELLAFTIRDISDEKRREVLERTFFHDVLNEAGIMVGFSQILAEGIVPLDKKSALRMSNIAKRVADTIGSQRDLLSAEKGELIVNNEEFNIEGFLKTIIEAYSESKYAKGKKILLQCNKNNKDINTDKVLLGRIVGNFIKNALEATEDGCIVTVVYDEKGGKNVFSVHNEEAMPEKVKLQIFNRSFSTKGQGRGVGTYSAKFIGEIYLKGSVYFKSDQDEGTTFFIEL